jgi:hypothetical protein
MTAVRPFRNLRKGRNASPGVPLHDRPMLMWIGASGVDIVGFSVRTDDDDAAH